MIEQLTFDVQVMPVNPPTMRGSGLQCCPRCPLKEVPISLTWTAKSEHRRGICRCGYWAEFTDPIGEGSLLAYGVEP
jgi:hypothetical protein